MLHCISAATLSTFADKCNATLHLRATLHTFADKCNATVHPCRDVVHICCHVQCYIACLPQRHPPRLTGAMRHCTSAASPSAFADVSPATLHPCCNAIHSCYRMQCKIASQPHHLTTFANRCNATVHRDRITYPRLLKAIILHYVFAETPHTFADRCNPTLHLRRTMIHFY